MDVFMKLFNQVRLVLKLMADSRVPLYLKVIPVLSLLYVVMPIDLVPDMIPILGQLDDVGVIILGIETFIRMSPARVVSEIRSQIEGSNVHDKTDSQSSSDNIVDGEWKEVRK